MPADHASGGLSLFGDRELWPPSFKSWHLLLSDENRPCRAEHVTVPKQRTQIADGIIRDGHNCGR